MENSKYLINYLCTICSNLVFRVFNKTDLFLNFFLDLLFTVTVVSQSNAKYTESQNFSKFPLLSDVKTKEILCNFSFRCHWGYFVSLQQCVAFSQERNFEFTPKMR